jgi:hypothetical protein
MAITVETYKLVGTKWVIEIDPNEQLDYSRDFTAYLAAVGDTIVTAAVIVDPKLILVLKGNDATHVTAWIAVSSTAVIGDLLPVTFRITTASMPPRIVDRSIWLKVKTK